MGTKSLQSTCGSQFAEHVLLGRDGCADEEINGICTLLRGQPLEQRQGPMSASCHYHISPM
jgi:hypothetical protein